MIEVRHLTRYYGEFAALDDVSFSVAEGRIVGLLGLNGAGKSTTLKILAGLIPPSSGTVTLDGVDLVAEPERLRSRIGYLPEDPPLYVDMRIEDFVRYIGRLKGMSADRVEARLDEVLATADLLDRRKQVIGTLSHGYRKRVGIAQAIIHDPRLVILDEPISGLDPVQIVEMRKVIRRLAAGRAVIVSSHILSEVEQTCDWLLVLRDGQLVAQGTEEELTQEVLEIVVRGEADALRALLDGHAAVETVQALDAIDDGQVRAWVVLDGDQREALAVDLVQAGFGLRHFSDEGGLEEAFVGLTRAEEAR